jgi:hypothetical protein
MGGEKIRKHSRLTDDLPEEIRKEVDVLLVQGSATYDEIKDFLAKKGFDISRSAIGRYGKGFLAMYQRLRIIEDKARTLVSEAGDGMVLEEAVSKTFSQMLLELLHDGKLKLAKSPKIIGEFARLQASTVLRERVKNEYAKKAAKTADAVVSSLKKSGLTDESAAVIRKKILEIAA